MQFFKKKYNTKQKIFNAAANHILSGNSARGSYINNSHVCAIGYLMPKETLYYISTSRLNGELIGRLKLDGEFVSDEFLSLVRALQRCNDTNMLSLHEKKERLVMIASVEGLSTRWLKK